MTDEKKDRVAYVERFFGDKEHRFAIHMPGTPEPMKLAYELEKATNSGPAMLFGNCVNGAWTVEQVRHIMRLGLIGGGKAPSEAHRLMSVYFDLAPAADHVPIALDIMTAFLFGVDPDDARPPLEQAGEIATSPEAVAREERMDDLRRSVGMEVPT